LLPIAISDSGNAQQHLHAADCRLTVDDRGLAAKTRAASEIAPPKKANEMRPLAAVTLTGNARVPHSSLGREAAAGLPDIEAAIVGVDVAALSEVTKRRRNGKTVKATHAHALQFAFRHCGYEGNNNQGRT
jgi:hypothetical protein